MSELEIEIGDHVFTVALLEDEAPESTAALLDAVPIEAEVGHVGWSGSAVATKLPDLDLPTLPRENNHAYPSRGDVMLYPHYEDAGHGQKSPALQELFIGCGPTAFNGPRGSLAANHVGIVDGPPLETRERLQAMESEISRNGTTTIEIR